VVATDYPVQGDYIGRLKCGRVVDEAAVEAVDPVFVALPLRFFSRDVDEALASMAVA